MDAHDKVDGESTKAGPSEESAAEDVPAWELVEPGRYMPRRIRGSLRGRELG
jgi:hypothetical protein